MASAAAAAVRIAVMYVPSMSAIGVPVSGSKSAMSAWCVGRSRFSSKSVTSLQPIPADGAYPGIAPSTPPRVNAPTRGTSFARVGGELRVRGRERVDELVEVEQLLDVGAGQDEHVPDGTPTRRP